MLGPSDMGASFSHYGLLFSGNKMSSWVETIKLWETERLISFLRSDSKLEGIELDDNFFTKLRGENITGDLFLKLTRWDFKEYGITLKQALELEDYIKKLCE